jgi:3-phosphoshikimate 1-carboxyvinyltransferase
MFCGIADGDTDVTGLAPGADVASTIACLAGLGVRIDTLGPLAVRIHGRGLSGLRQSAAPLDAGNSGTTMRLMSGILASLPFSTTMTGDASLARRPMTRVLDPLARMGARVTSADGRAPITIAGGSLSGIRWQSPVASAQVKSAVLLAGLSASGRTDVEEPLATRDHTERALPLFGVSVDVAGLVCGVAGGQTLLSPGGTLTVPGDPSSAAVWAAAAASRPGSDVRLDGVCLNPQRLGALDALRRMGAEVEVTRTASAGNEPIGTIRVRGGGLRATSIGPAEVPSLIDELPILAACAALGGGLEVSGASELRVKESDRITALVTGFRALGVDATERPDGFVIDGSRRPSGGTADAASDHRLVMAFALVGLGASGPTTITDAGAVAISYPQFERDMQSLVE